MKNNVFSVTSSTLSNEDTEKLLQCATDSGASKAVILPVSDITIEDALADMCLEPKCENYGLSKSCPPNVSGPSGFRDKLKECHQALFFKIDVPANLLFSSDRREIFQLLHEIAADIEQTAVSLGYNKAKAFAGGSCKNIFCHEFAECAVLSAKGKCRHPSSARQSMSGFGINVSKLMGKAGWPVKKAIMDSASTSEKMSHVCGLVLVY